MLKKPSIANAAAPIAAEYVAKSEKTICTSDSLNHLLLLETVS